MKKYALSLVCLGMLGFGVGCANAAAAACDPTTQICNLQVYIEENSVPYSTLQPLLEIAPNLTQLHLRVDANVLGLAPSYGPPYSATNPAVVNIVALIKQISQNYPNIKFGFHPDNSTSSYTLWGCTAPSGKGTLPGGPYPPTWGCVFTNSMAFMNAVNAQLPPGSGFTIFSLEQSYVESAEGGTGLTPPGDNDDVGNEKLCLQGKSVTNLCTSTQVAQPAVQYGYVGPSCGAAGLYDAQHFDYGYPQMYNLLHNWTYTKGDTSLPQSIFDGGVYPDPGTKFVLLDGFMPADAWKFPKNSVFLPYAFNGLPQTGPAAGNIYTIYQSQIVPGTGTDAPNPQVAAQTLAELLVTKYGATPSPFPCGRVGAGSTSYFTLSGENEFLGSTGWTPSQLAAFYTDLVSDLIKLGVPSSVANAIPFGIWSVDTMNLTGDGPG